MRVCGVICEYDPFHNGHAVHLAALRERTACDYIVCVMSGHFTQRGDPALLSKWARAEMALRCGADAVFELPALFAVRDAERFARGGVGLLTALGVVTHLGFGSETGDLDALTAAAARVAEGDAVREGLALGQTLARARGEAAGLAKGAPNDTLAMEYLRALDGLRSPLKAVAIRREGHGHHDRGMGEMASATAVRAAIRRGEDVNRAVPAPARALLTRLLAEGAYQAAGGLDGPLLAILRTMPREALAGIADVGEGLEHRLLRAAQEAADREALLGLTKCKRYTRARLSRVLTQTMLGMTKSLALQYPLPTYARLLGFREDARPLLHAVRARAAVPVVTRAARQRKTGDRAFALDIRAGDLWALGLTNAFHRRGHIDMLEKVVILGKG